MVTPKSATTAPQPIAVGDAVGLLRFDPTFQRT
jgi:hypothetical protein